MEKKCAVCGNAVEEGARVCQHCGAAQEDAFGEWRAEDVVVIDPLGAEDKERKQWEAKLKKRETTTVVVLLCVLAVFIIIVGCLYVDMNRTYTISSMELQNGDEYSIDNGDLTYTGHWQMFDDTYECVSFELTYQITEVIEGDPYGMFDIYILKSDGSYEKVASMSVIGTREERKSVELDRATSMNGVAVISRADGEFSYMSSLAVSNLVVKE